MASRTPQKLKDAALFLFSSRWFETVSVAEVCRKAGVSNGVFYRYFRSKEDIVRALLDEFLTQFESDLKISTGNSVDERLTNLFQTIFDAGIKHASQVTVFREGQYRFPEYEDRLRVIYIRACEKVFNRHISEAEYLFIISGLRFNSTRALYDKLPRRVDILKNLVLNGVFPDSAEVTLQIPASFLDIPKEPPTDSRESLIASGMALLGMSGYHNIGIADIVRDSDLAVGTFYTYFKSKEDFFSEIVTQIGKKSRHYLSEKARTHGNRLEQEVYGVWHFLCFFNKHLQYYSIIREAEFIAKPWVGSYYNAFEKGYMENLQISNAETRKIISNFLMGLSHYIGIEALLNQRIADIPEFLSELAILMRTGVKQ